MNKQLIALFLFIFLIVPAQAAIVCNNSTSCVETNLNVTISTSFINNQTILNIINNQNNFTVSVSNNITTINNNLFNISFNNVFTNTFANNFNFTANFRNNITMLQNLNSNITVVINNSNTNVFSFNNNVSVRINASATFINSNQNNISLVTKVNVTNLYTNRYYFNNSLSCPAITTGACAPVINVPACPTPRINVTNIFSFPPGITPAIPINDSYFGDTSNIIPIILLSIIVFIIYKKTQKKNSKETQKILNKQTPPPPGSDESYFDDVDADLDSNLSKLNRR